MKNKNFFKNIKAVGFDFDNTLVDESYSIKKRWQKVLKEYSFLHPVLEKTFFKIYKQKGPSYKFHVQDTLRQLDIDKDFTKKIVSKFLKTRSDELVFDGALEILGLLKSKGIKIGIITDGKKPYQQKRIKGAELYKFMDFIFYGKGKKEKKPNKRTVQLLKKRFKFFKIKFPEQFLYIGDDFYRDIEGMSSFSAKVCWLKGKKNMPQFPNLLKIRNLKELSKHFLKEMC